MVSSVLLLWFILPFALVQSENQEEQRKEAYQTILALYFLSFTTSFFFLLFLSILCIRWQRARSARNRIDNNILLHVVQSMNSRPSGIDENVIKSLPLFQFASLSCSSDGPVDCAICLSKFESTDVVRVLPKCKHTFHVQCIDQWLWHHSNCPVCRQKLEVHDVTSSIHLHEAQSAGLMEEGTTQGPNGDSLNRGHRGTAARDDRDAPIPV